ALAGVRRRPQHRRLRARRDRGPRPPVGRPGRPAGQFGGGQRCQSPSVRPHGPRPGTAGPTGSRWPRPMRPVHSAGRPSCRTPSARTAGTTVGVRSLRSTKRQPIEKALGVRFGGEELYVWAFTHRSFAYENGGLPTNERLEFLGDAVLGLVVTDIIYRAFPDLPDGQLAKLRAATVNMNVLAEVARELGVGDAVPLRRGEELSGGRDKPSILADTLEAVLGAIYLDKGLSRAAALVRRLFEPRGIGGGGRAGGRRHKDPGPGG